MKKLTIAVLAALISASAAGTVFADQSPVQVAQNEQTEQEKAKDPSIVSNPVLMKDLLRSRTFRDQLMLNEDMVRQAMQNEEVRKEMLIYPDIQTYIMRRDDLMNMLSEKEKKMIKR